MCYNPIVKTRFPPKRQPCPMSVRRSFLADMGLGLKNPGTVPDYGSEKLGNCPRVG